MIKIYEKSLKETGRRHLLDVSIEIINHVIKSLYRIHLVHKSSIPAYQIKSFELHKNEIYRLTKLLKRV